jgi:phosphomannomutase
VAEIKFGTDGWRAVIAEDFTFANLDRVAQATAEYWKRNPVPKAQKSIVIGYDRRFLSDQFARRVAEIMLGNGFAVLLSSVPTPTPAVSFAVKTRQATGGVMITASHNPPSFNGFKLKASFGGSAEPSTCQAIEALLDKAPIKTTAVANGTGGGLQIADFRTEHFAAVKGMTDFDLIAKSKLKFAHDPLFGVGAGCFEQLLAGTSCRVTTLNANHDPFFGGLNPEPIARNYGPTRKYLSKHPHDLCLVTDGDADRVGGMDGKGNTLSTHQLICLLLHHYVINRGARGRMIKALTATSMVDKMCAAYGLELVETGVGFKYIAAEMLKGNYVLGAEESGGIGFPGHIPERDGILAGLMLLELLATEKTSINKLIAALEKKFGPHRYARIDTHFPVEKRARLMEFCKRNPPVKLLKSPVAEIRSYDGVKFIARDGSWLMLRGSGTEPILRIYAETSTDAGAQQLLEEGLRMTKRI